MVWHAEHRITGEIVALKKALPGRQCLQRLQREISVQRSLSHEHIMPILDASETGRWFTMPLAKDTLAQRVARAPISDLPLAEILYSVARGLQYAHKRGHIHRDVTPGNILRIKCNPHGDRWVVADWGLVQKPEGQASLPLTLTGQVLGTRSFGPPELMTTPHGVGAEVDVYYIGAVAAWALSGTEPSHDKIPQTGRPEWDAFISKLTKRDPVQRPQSMVDVLADLHEMREAFGELVRWRGEHQAPLFVMHPCGVCGTEVEGIRCGKCGAYYDE